MTQHTERTESGFITYSTIDAEFMFEGKQTFMEVHHYCGPSFYTLDENECEVWLEPDDTIRWKDLWKVYTDWDNIPEYELTGNSLTHVTEDTKLIPFLFYWEEAENSYTPAPDNVENIISTESLDDGEYQDIKFKRFDMTQTDYDNLPIG